MFVFIKKFSKYPYSLIYEKNTISEIRLLSDKTISSNIKSKILTDRISFINTTETKVYKFLYPLDLSDHVFLFPGLVNNISFTKRIY